MEHMLNARHPYDGQLCNDLYNMACYLLLLPHVSPSIAFMSVNLVVCVSILIVDYFSDILWSFTDFTIKLYGISGLTFAFQVRSYAARKLKDKSKGIQLKQS